MPTLIRRIEEKYFISPDGCWLWTASVDAAGYGRIGISNGKYERAHRALYKIYNGEIEDKLVLDHLCKQRSCVNPYHLEPVTQKENVRRGSMVKYICVHGNPMSTCSRECHNQYVRIWYSKTKEKGD
jgi:hypothetical protein